MTTPPERADVDRDRARRTRLAARSRGARGHPPVRARALWPTSARAPPAIRAAPRPRFASGARARSDRAARRQGERAALRSSAGVLPQRARAAAEVQLRALSERRRDARAGRARIALEQVCARAELRDGMRVLDLGCGWGSLSLCVAERFPNARVVAVSNSKPQREHILAECRAPRTRRTSRSITADVADFEPEGRFDRVVSIEMFEHVRNWDAAARARRALARAGAGSSSCTSSVTASSPTRTRSRDSGDWMARHFFSGGIMPSAGLIRRFDRALRVEAEWRVSGHALRAHRRGLARQPRSRARHRPAYLGRAETRARRRARSRAGGSSSWRWPSSSASRAASSGSSRSTACSRPARGPRDEDRDRRRGRLGSGLRAPAAPAPRRADLRGRRDGSADTRTPCASKRAAATFDVETGFVVYNERTYPLFSRLLAELGVATRPSEMSFSVSCERTGLEYNGGSLGGLFAQRRNLLRPSFLGMLRDALRFYREAPALLEAPDAKLSLGDWLAGRGYGDGVRRRSTCCRWARRSGRASRARSPTSRPLAFARFFANHGLLQLRDRPQWRVVDGGSARYVERLCARLPRPRPARARRVRAVRRHAGSRRRSRSRAARRATFDHVIFANHADQALACLRDATRAERAMLSAIRYDPNDVVLHTDASLLPRLRRARAAWNFHVSAQPGGAATVTYDMARLQGIDAPVDLLVTLNRTAAIDERRVLRRFSYHHPVYDRAALEAQAERRVISGVNRTSFCGAYWGYGFHEDGVRSAHARRGRARSRRSEVESCIYDRQRPARAPRRRCATRSATGSRSSISISTSFARVFAGSRLFASERRAPASFRREDHFGDPGLPLDECVRRLVRERCGVRPDGPIRLLTLPRVLGARLQSDQLVLLLRARGLGARRRSSLRSRTRRGASDTATCCR